MKTVIIDNYDSFTFNLYQLVGELDQRPLVFRNDEIDLAGLIALQPERVILSPGPGRPDDPIRFGVCLDAIRALGPKVPTLGVCLGHQGIIHAFGGRVVRAPLPMHGKTSLIHHDGRDLFHTLPQPFEAMRYHSLVGAPESLPSCLVRTAWTEDGIIMGVRHETHPVFGVQFHPESIGTPEGRRLLANFLASG